MLNYLKFTNLKDNYRFLLSIFVAIFIWISFEITLIKCSKDEKPKYTDRQIDSLIIVSKQHKKIADSLIKKIQDGGKNIDSLNNKLYQIMKENNKLKKQVYDLQQIKNSIPKVTNVDTAINIIKSSLFTDKSSTNSKR